VAGRGGERGRGHSAPAKRPTRVRRTRPAVSVPDPAPTPAKTKARRAILGLSTTRRAAVVATVVCALALSVAVPLRTYLSQRSDVQAQEQRQAELRARVDELEHRKAQLADPAQTRIEARKRLRYVMPGETPYMVELPDQAANPSQGEQAATPSHRGSWYEGLWDSVNGR
jgi:cell division protein FtsB